MVEAKITSRDNLSSTEMVELDGGHRLQMGGDTGDGYCYGHQSFNCIENLTKEESEAISTAEDCVPEREDDGEHQIEIKVRVRSYGKLEQVTSEVALELARACRNQFADRFELEDEAGRIYEYDFRGDDMGHHGPEHNEPLKLRREEARG